MKAIILAAGRGSRLESLTDNQPKCRVKLHGKQLIEWQIDSLNNSGIKHLAIVRGYMADNFQYDFQYFDNKRWDKTNMVVSLLAASQWLEREECIISYSDIVYSSDTVNRLINADGEIVIAYDPNWLVLWKMRFKNPLSDAETLKIERGKIIEIGKRTSDLEDIEGQYMGLLKISPSGWLKISNYLDTLTENEVDNLDMTGMLNNLIISGVTIRCVPIREKWYEVDSQTDLNCYQELESLW
jgi:L-glutamine-phosphate cytidylyltransferase